MYVTKYAAKPEKHFYIEAEEAYQKDSVKFFLKARTVGLCMAHNRLFNFRVVRSTVPVVYHHTEFVPKPWGRCERDATHREKHPGYPDPDCYMNGTQKYFFRDASLRHLRLEQWSRYFCHDSGYDSGYVQTDEDTHGLVETEGPPDINHRHHDAAAEAVPPGRSFASRAPGVQAARKRRRDRLAVSRAPIFELMGDQRDKHYEQRLLLGLPWLCESTAADEDDEGLTFELGADLPMEPKPGRGMHARTAEASPLKRPAASTASLTGRHRQRTAGSCADASAMQNSSGDAVEELPMPPTQPSVATALTTALDMPTDTPPWAYCIKRHLEKVRCPHHKPARPCPKIEAAGSGCGLGESFTAHEEPRLGDDMQKSSLWKFTAALPRPVELGGLVLRVPTLTLAADSKVSFETICRDLEHELTRSDLGDYWERGFPRSVSLA